MMLFSVFLVSIGLGILADKAAGTFPLFFLAGVSFWLVRLFVISNKKG